ncbi:MAG: T9SS type A sorting domain-containing protein [Flavobacterium sp.]|nr:T9SS type A sorting domain-containing protein [Flavobacterium sp.]
MMKKYLNFFLLSLLLFFASLSYGQTYTVTMSNVYVNNQWVNQGSAISFGANDIITVKLSVDVYSSTGNSGTLNVYYQRGSSYEPIVPSGGYGGTITGSGSRNFTIELNGAQFDASGGFIFAQFAVSGHNGAVPRSSNWPVIKPGAPPISNNSIVGTQTKFYGLSATITGTTPSGGNGSYFYQWQKNTTGSWSNIVGAHEQNYITELLTQTTQFRRIVMSNGTSDHTSGAVVVTIVNSLPITNNSISGNQTINEGNTASFITGTSPSGGSGPESYRYVWQKKSGNSTWTIIPNASSQNYSPGTPFVTTHYRRIVKSGNAVDITSNEVTITVIPAPPIQNNTIVLNNGTINGSQPTGGIGVYNYSWILWGGEEPYTFPNTEQNLVITADIYNYLTAYPNLFIVRTVTSGSQISGSNSIVILPLPAIQNNVISLNGSLVTGSQPTGGNGDYKYTWNLVGGEESYVFPETSQNLVLSASVFQYLEMYPNLFISRTVNSGNKISYSNNVTLVALPQIQNNTISANGLQIIGSQPTGGDNTYQYSWFISSPEDPIFFPDTTRDLDLNPYSNAIRILQTYPTAVLYRLVKSANRSSYSNSLSFYSGRQRQKEMSFAQGNENFDSEPKVYPNPTTKRVNFETGLAKTTTVEITATNELGINIVIFKGDVNPGQVIEWNIPSNYPKGLYFYKILSGKEEIKTGKILYQ